MVWVNMMTTVSIMITCFNNEDSISDAISSVVSQRGNFKLEILVGDDGSSDGTQKVIQEWIDIYPNTIKMYVMPRDAGTKSGFPMRSQGRWRNCCEQSRAAANLNWQNN